jgi:hypothetical protein
VRRLTLRMTAPEILRLIHDVAALLDRSRESS